MKNGVDNDTPHPQKHMFLAEEMNVTAFVVGTC